MKKLSLFVVLAFCFVFAGYSQLPPVTLTTIEGKSVNTAELNNDGKPYIISFFALWCKPCLRELNAIMEVYEDWQEETGVKVVAVSIDEAQNAYKVAPAVNGYGWEYEVLLDNNKDFMRAMNVTSVPSVFVIDGENNIVKRKTSYTDGSEEELIQAVRDLLNK